MADYEGLGVVLLDDDARKGRDVRQCGFGVVGIEGARELELANSIVFDLHIEIAVALKLAHEVGEWCRVKFHAALGPGCGAECGNMIRFGDRPGVSRIASIASADARFLALLELDSGLRPRA